MFKNLTAFHLPEASSLNPATLEDAFARNEFAPCLATQPISMGWVPVRDIKHGAFVGSLNGHLLARIRIEKKTVPAALVKRHLRERIETYRAETGREAGKKLQREMKEAIVQELLPQAFPKQEDVGIWIDRAAKRLVLDCASTSKADGVITALCKAVEQLVVAPLVLQQSSSAVMTGWLRDQESPAAFGIDQQCQLEGGENKPQVTYARLSVDVEEVRSQIAQGLTVKSLALTWSGKVSLLLCNGPILKKLKMLDIATERQLDEAWDGTMAIMTSEISRLLDDLVIAHGGLDNEAMQSATNGSNSLVPEDKEHPEEEEEDLAEM